MITSEDANIGFLSLTGLISSVLATKRSSLHWQRESVRAKRVHFVFAICLSVCLHLAALNLILWSRNDAIGGIPSPALDGARLGTSSDMAPLNLTLVSPHSGEVLRAPDASNSGKHVSWEKEDATRAASETSTDQTPTETIRDGKKIQPAVTSALESNALATTALAANGEEGGTSEIISQIARCLPAGQHPRLSTKLYLAVGEKGQLTMVPALDMDLEKSSPDEIRSANMIIQATLQCAPYPVSAEMNAAYSFVADFSQVNSKN